MAQLHQLMLAQMRVESELQYTQQELARQRRDEQRLQEEMEAQRRAQAEELLQQRRQHQQEMEMQQQMAATAAADAANRAAAAAAQAAMTACRMMPSVGTYDWVQFCRDEGFAAPSQQKERGDALCCACERSAKDPRMFQLVSQMMCLPSGSQPDLHGRSTKPPGWTPLHFVADGKAKSEQARGEWTARLPGTRAPLAWIGAGVGGGLCERSPPLIEASSPRAPAPGQAVASGTS